MKRTVWVLALALATLQAHSYVLLTANIEDLQAIAQRIVDSPMADQVHNILRRASSVFTHHVNRADDEDGSYLRAERRSDTKHSQEIAVTTRTTTIADSLPLGKNASVFLKSIKKIFENV